MSFEFTYSKPDMSNIIHQMEKEPIEFYESQLYSPVNNLFLELNNTNFQSTTLNYNRMMKTMYEAVDDHVIKLECLQGKKQMDYDSFVKFSPILDPIRYLVGKYDLSDSNLTRLPKFDSSNAHPKSLDFDNASYVDSFFSYLSSQMFHYHKLINAIDCYGTLLGKKRRFIVDTYDDFEYLANSDFFIKNKNILYELSDEGNQMMGEILEHDSRGKKCKIDISDKLETIDCDDFAEIEELNIVFDNDNDNDNNYNKTTSLEQMSNHETMKLTEENLLQIKKRNSSKSTLSTTCSSRTSLTGDSIDDKTECDPEDCGSVDNNSDSTSTSSNSSQTSNTESMDEVCNVTIFDFPSQAIFLEKCEGTLDELCAKDDDFGSEELVAALMQVIITLIAYHKCFDFQHNDLHTNNIMYVSTKKQFLYYKVNDTHYKVPTYGRIFKIIDFGRATYKFRSNQLCSDSFHKEGDAHTQFNFSRHYNANRPVLMPNNSFDLCRLGTSLIDFMGEDLEEIKESKDPVIQMVWEWCTDDKGRNVLWKSNGDERYPGFKLYKMIARTVSKHTPISQLERPIIDKFRCSRKNIKKGTSIMNIDKLPCYV